MEAALSQAVRYVELWQPRGLWVRNVQLRANLHIFHVLSPTIPHYLRPSLLAHLFDSFHIILQSGKNTNTPEDSSLGLAMATNWWVSGQAVGYLCFQEMRNTTLHKAAVSLPPYRLLNA